MTILNFEEGIKNRSSDRPSDVILNSLNRLYDAKLTGAVTPDELSKIIVLTGDLFANKIRQGKVSMDEIDATETLIDGFGSSNRYNYFDYKHEHLDSAAKMFLEGDYVAIEQMEKRSFQSKPVDENYMKGLKKFH